MKKPNHKVLPNGKQVPIFYGKQHPNFHHGMHGTKFYKIWENMKSRTLNKNNTSYRNYGERGIGINDSWRIFLNFKNDMYPSYALRSDSPTLERINNDQGYSKENCRWATFAEQSRNKSSNILFKGECARDASRRLGGSSRVVDNRIAMGWEIERAFMTPVVPRSRAVKSSLSSE